MGSAKVQLLDEEWVHESNRFATSNTDQDTNDDAQSKTDQDTNDVVALEVYGR